VSAPTVPSTSCSTRSSGAAARPRALAALVALLAWATPVAAALGAPPDADGVRAAVERANSTAVWGEALRRGDPAPLATVWAGDPLVYFSGEVRAYHARGLRLLSTLVELEFLDVAVLPGGRAVAETRERWADRMCSSDGVLHATRAPVVRDRYELVWRSDAWWIVGVDIALEAGSLDWTPASEAPGDAGDCA
jgi:hypothetical protein